MTTLFRNPKSIYNPFVYIAGKEALITGLAIIAITGLVGWLSHNWLDGMLDMHYGPQGALWMHIALGLTNWLSAVAVFTPMAMALSPSRVRIIDIAGTMALARFPMLLAVATGFLNAPRKLAQWTLHTYLEQGDPVALSWMDILLAGMALIAIVCMVVWVVVLMYNAYKISANISGTKAGVSFTIAMIIAYVISKVAAGLLIHNFAVI